MDFLDVTLDLNTGIYKAYSKPNNIPVYVHAKSNHHPSVIKAIPLGVNKRLNMISANEEVFREKAPMYQEALDKAGHKHKLVYEKVDLHSLNKKKKQRKRKIIYFVPPFDRRVKTKIGKQFLQILDRTIPKGHKLYPVLNRHTVKLGYTNMPNLMSMVSHHNSKVAREARLEQNIANNQVPIQQQELPCNCDLVRLNIDECPLDGRCRAEMDVVYSAKVSRTDNNTSETYTGMTKGTFKSRWYGHRRNISIKAERTKTKLATHIWTLKDQRPPVPHTIKWKIIDKGKPFNPVTGICRLCLKEKYHILYNKEVSSLNTRDEVYGHCPHKRDHLLYKIKEGVT